MASHFNWISNFQRPLFSSPLRCPHSHCFWVSVIKGQQSTWTKPRPPSWKFGNCGNLSIPAGSLGTNCIAETWPDLKTVTRNNKEYVGLSVCSITGTHGLKKVCFYWDKRNKLCFGGSSEKYKVVSMLSRVAQWLKNPSAMQETQEMQVRSLGQEDPLEEGMATHSSVPRESHRQRSLVGYIVHGVANSWTQLKRLSTYSSQAWTWPISSSI